MESQPPSGFVIALCAVERAIAIPQPRSAPLNRYRFFLTRRNAEGREFFVLHMGYFETAEEAEKWIERLRGTYPNAYVCETSDRLSRESSELTDTQTLRVLEARPPEPAFVSPKPAPSQTASKPEIRSLLDESLEDLASREVVDTGTHDVLNDTGVRHLSIEVVKRRSWGRGRSRAR